MDFSKEIQAAPDKRKRYEVSTKTSLILLILLTFLYLLAYMDRSVITVVVEPMKAQLGFNDAQIGFLQTIFLISVGLLMIPAGIIVDRWSRRKTIGLMAIMWSFATLATGMGSSYGGLLAARFFTGSGEAGFASGGVAWLSLTFSKTVRSRVLGIFNTGIPIGSALGVVLGGMIATKTGNWRAPFYFFAIPGILLGILAFFLPDYTTQGGQPGQMSNKTTARDAFSLFRIRSFTFASLGFALWLFLGFGAMGWFPALLMREYGLNASKAGGIYGLMILMGAIGAPLGGVLSDKWQRKNSKGRNHFAMITICLGTLTKLILFLIVGLKLGLFLAVGMIDGVIALLSSPAFFSITQDVVPPKLRATSMAFSGIIVFLLGGAWGPVIVGTLSDFFGGGASGLRLAMITMVPFGLLGSLLFYFGGRYYPSDSEAIEDVVMAEEK